MQPDRIFVGGAPRIGRDPPAGADDPVLDQSEDEVGVAGVDGEQHGRCYLRRDALASETAAAKQAAMAARSPNWIMDDACCSWPAVLSALVAALHLAIILGGSDW